MNLKSGKIILSVATGVFLIGATAFSADSQKIRLSLTTSWVAEKFSSKSPKISYGYMGLNLKKDFLQKACLEIELQDNPETHMYEKIVTSEYGPLDLFGGGVGSVFATYEISGSEESVWVTVEISFNGRETRSNHYIDLRNENPKNSNVFAIMDGPSFEGKLSDLMEINLGFDMMRLHPVSIIALCE